MITLADERKIAVRPSGTEPKIKYYMFGARRPAAGSRFSSAELAEAKAGVTTGLSSLWKALESDAKSRLA